MNRLLVPVDFSSATAHVIQVAGSLARSLQAEIHLVHVNEIAPAIPPVGTGYAMAGMPELMPTSTLSLGQAVTQAITPNESEKQRLAEWQNDLQQQGLRVALHEVSGDVVEELLRAAESTESDLIVMARHSHGAMYHLLVGSVTEGVLKRSRRPVLLVPETTS